MKVYLLLKMRRFERFSSLKILNVIKHIERKFNIKTKLCKRSYLNENKNVMGPYNSQLKTTIFSNKYIFLQVDKFK